MHVIRHILKSFPELETTGFQNHLTDIGYISQSIHVPGFHSVEIYGVLVWIKTMVTCDELWGI